MPTNEQPITRHGITQDMPLPGFYPCLTLQLNVTRYAAGTTVRWVAIVREPNEQVETYRAHQDTTDWGVDTVDGLCNELRQALINMVWLQEGKSS